MSAKFVQFTQAMTGRDVLVNAGQITHVEPRQTGACRLWLAIALTDDSQDYIDVVGSLADVQTALNGSLVPPPKAHPQTRGWDVHPIVKGEAP